MMKTLNRRAFIAQSATGLGALLVFPQFAEGK